jgi:hypothetical protein
MRGTHQNPALPHPLTLTHSKGPPRAKDLKMTKASSRYKQKPTIIKQPKTIWKKKTGKLQGAGADPTKSKTRGK